MGLMRRLPLSVLSVFATLTCISAQTDSPTMPVFIGLLHSQSSGAQFAMRWKNGSGATFQSWLRIGQKAGEYELIAYDEQSQAVSLKRSDGSIIEVFIEGKKVDGEMTDEEYKRLRQFLLRERHAEAPVLTREAARAFWLRLMRDFAEPPSPGVFLDLDGSTLPLDKRQWYLEGREKARAAGRLSLVVVMDGTPTFHEYPRNVLGIPEPMTHNLLSSDWDELSLLAALNRLPRKRPRNAQ